ncbi:MAG: lipoprotein [Neisseriaceae bacterium]|nr:lipoprotein [Neisseriaceae bacterium]
MKFALFLMTLFALSACGFKGDLYLPKDHDDAVFAPVQTGIGLKPPAPDEQNIKENQNVE